MSPVGAGGGRPQIDSRANTEAFLRTSLTDSSPSPPNEGGLHLGSGGRCLVTAQPSTPASAPSAYSQHSECHAPTPLKSDVYCLWTGDLSPVRGLHLPTRPCFTSKKPVFQPLGLPARWSGSRQRGGESIAKSSASYTYANLAPYFCV